MTREQIEQAANLYIGNEPEVDEGVCVSMRRIAFVHGAEWRINSVWHDASEEPKENKLVLTEDDYDGESDYCICQVTFPKWEDDVIIFRTKRWAYIDDLLPARKEETK